jgi:hypothetical protein
LPIVLHAGRLGAVTVIVIPGMTGFSRRRVFAPEKLLSECLVSLLLCVTCGLCIPQPLGMKWDSGCCIARTYIEM